MKPKKISLRQREDRFFQQVRRALLLEGAIIPTSVEEVRQAKARLKQNPVALPAHFTKPALLHVGKKCPKGWTEKSAMHLGNGVWALRCEEWRVKKVIDG